MLLIRAVVYAASQILAGCQLKPPQDVQREVAGDARSAVAAINDVADRYSRV